MFSLKQYIKYNALIVISASDRDCSKVKIIQWAYLYGNTHTEMPIKYKLLGEVIPIPAIGKTI